MKKIEMSKVINYFTYKYSGDWDYIYDAIQNKEKIDEETLTNFINEQDHQVKYISIIDEKYPNNFKAIYMPPLTVYYAGNQELFDHKNIISLFGNINFETIKKINQDIDCVFALEANENNIQVVQQLEEKRKFILVGYNKFDQELISKFKFQKNVLYISEIPVNSSKLFRQKTERMLLGIGSSSIFINTNDQEFEKYKEIHLFEKRKMFVYGDFKKEYLIYANKYKSINH